MCQPYINGCRHTPANSYTVDTCFIKLSGIALKSPGNSPGNPSSAEREFKEGKKPDKPN